jgi:hypothetical protein
MLHLLSNKNRKNLSEIEKEIFFVFLIEAIDFFIAKKQNMTEKKKKRVLFYYFSLSFSLARNCRFLVVFINGRYCHSVSHASS